MTRTEGLQLATPPPGSSPAPQAYEWEQHHQRVEEHDMDEDVGMGGSQDDVSGGYCCCRATRAQRNNSRGDEAANLAWSCSSRTDDGRRRRLERLASTASRRLIAPSRVATSLSVPSFVPFPTRSTSRTTSSRSSSARSPRRFPSTSFARLDRQHHVAFVFDFFLPLGHVALSSTLPSTRRSITRGVTFTSDGTDARQSSEEGRRRRRVEGDDGLPRRLREVRQQGGRALLARQDGWWE